MKKYKDFNVGVKQSIVIVLIAIIGSVSGYFLNQMYTKQVQYGNLLAVTERQAMILKLLSASMPPNANLTNQSTQQIQNNSFLFQSAQVALLHGGKVANTIYILPQADAEDKKANKLLRTIDKLWSQYKQESQRSASTKSDEQQANIQDILSSLEKQTWELNTHFQELSTKHNQWMNTAMALLAIIIVAMIGVVYLLLEKFLKTPIRQIAEVSVRAASGDLSHTVAYHADDELGKIAQSLNRVTQNQLQLSDFAEKIGEGDFTIQYTQLGEGDKLGQSLVTMREKLQKISAEDRKRIWATEGMAKFGELLRSNSDTIEHLAEKIIVDLIKYLQANQGAIFITQEEQENVYLELVASYAWNRKKYLQRRVEPGEGLVGQVYRDKDTVYLTDIPQDFVTITSGLGKANPTCMLLVPLKVNEEVHGVIELASFKEFAPYEIEYVEKLSESIASTLSTVKTNGRTKKLLADARRLNDQMRQQEEVMRQNLEELNSTQEEMQRKEVELTGLFTSINNTLLTVEFDLNGFVLTANENFCRLMNYSLEEIKGEHHGLFSDKQYMRSEEYRQLWQELKRGVIKAGDEKNYTKTGKERWISGSYTPVLDKSGNPYKIIHLAHDITEKKRDEIQARRLSLVADNTDNSVIITNKDGQIEFVNEGFTRMTGYALEDVLNKTPSSFLQGPDTNQETVLAMRKCIQEKKPFTGEVLNYNKQRETYWISLSINPVFTEKGDIDKFISVQANITETKIKNLEYNSKLEAISKSNCVVEFTMQGNILQANENFLKLMEYSQEEIKGKHHSIFVSTVRRNMPEYKQLWQKLNNNEFVSGDFIRITKSGKEIWVRGIYNVILDIDGNPSRIIKFVQDITSEKHLELEAKKQAQELSQQGEKLRKYTAELEELQRTLSKKLEEAKAEMKIQIKDLEAEKAKNTAILEGCVDGVVAFNHRGTVEFFNKAAEDIWRLSRAEVLRRSITLLMPIKFVDNGLDDGSSKVIFSDKDTIKDIGIRTEVSFTDKDDEEVAVLLTLTQAKHGDEHTYTLFVQKISVELF
jgi:PAS domain S-box-containing protein